MKKSHFENLFNFMREHGHFNEYEDYRQFRKERHGVDTTSEERQEKYDNWKSSLSEKDKQDFNEMFGE